MPSKIRSELSNFSNTAMAFRSPSLLNSIFKACSHLSRQFSLTSSKKKNSSKSPDKTRPNVPETPPPSQSELSSQHPMITTTNGISAFPAFYALWISEQMNSLRHQPAQIFVSPPLDLLAAFSMSVCICAMSQNRSALDMGNRMRSSSGFDFKRGMVGG